MKKNILSVLIVVFLAFSVLVSPANAKSPLRDSAEIKGPTTLYLGKSYKYQLRCTDINTNYAEFGFVSRISNPRIIAGGGILNYDFDQFPGWLGWRGQVTDKLIIQFTLTPEAVGNYTVHLECWGQEVFETDTLEIIVLD